MNVVFRETAFPGWKRRTAPDYNTAHKLAASLGYTGSKHRCFACLPWEKKQEILSEARLLTKLQQAVNNAALRPQNTGTCNRANRFCETNSERARGELGDTEEMGKRAAFPRSTPGPQKSWRSLFAYRCDKSRFCRDVRQSFCCFCSCRRRVAGASDDEETPICGIPL